MLSRTSRAGAASLLLAPVIVIAAALIQPTLSDEAAKQVAALRLHHGAVILGLTLSNVSLLLLIAGMVWLALTLAPRVPRLAVVGGVLGVFGSLVVLFENGVSAATPSIVSGLDPVQATTLVHHLHTGTAVAAVEPLSILGDIGLALLGVATARVGAPRWSALAIAVGALGEGAGFATGTKGAVIAAFAIMLIGLLQVVRVLMGAHAGSAAPARGTQVISGFSAAREGA